MDLNFTVSLSDSGFGLERNRLIKEKLASDVNEREAYIKRLHRLIEVSLDMSQHPELAELMGEAPKLRSYES